MKLKSLLVALAALTLMNACTNTTTNTADAVLENIHARKSVRQFTDEPVSAEHIETMLRAAMAAPTAVNYQPWRFVVINERAQLDAMTEILPFAKMLKQAPLAIIVCGETTWFDGKENIFWQQDCSAATQNLLLAAEALGLGSKVRKGHRHGRLASQIPNGKIQLLFRLKPRGQMGVPELGKAQGQIGKGRELVLADPIVKVDALADESLLLLVQ